MGRDGATTWKAGTSLPPATRRGRILATSRKLPGPAVISAVFSFQFNGGNGKRTAVREEQRDCPLYIALLVYKMDIQGFEAIDLNIRMEIGELIQFSLLFPPIVFLLPVLNQSFHLGQWNAIVPIDWFKFIWEFGEIEFLSQSLKFVVGYRYGVWLNRCHRAELEERNERFDKCREYLSASGQP